MKLKLTCFCFLSSSHCCCHWGSCAIVCGSCDAFYHKIDLFSKLTVLFLIHRHLPHWCISYMPHYFVSLLPHILVLLSLLQVTRFSFLSTSCWAVWVLVPSSVTHVRSFIGRWILWGRGRSSKSNLMEPFLRSQNLPLFQMISRL